MPLVGRRKKYVRNWLKDRRWVEAPEVILYRFLTTAVTLIPERWRRSTRCRSPLRPEADLHSAKPPKNGTWKNSSSSSNSSNNNNNNSSSSSSSSSSNRISSFQLLHWSRRGSTIRNGSAPNRGSMSIRISASTTFSGFFCLFGWFLFSPVGSI